MLPDETVKVIYDKQQLSEQIIQLQDQRLINLLGEILRLARNGKGQEEFIQSYNQDLEKVHA